ncbi:MAG: alkaline phosphatase family protein, partial [Ilyomonas sp.]
MRKIFISFLLLVIACSGFSQVKHVVVISVDGLRPDFYLDTSWHANTIRDLMKKGTYAKGVNSVFPSMTYPSHTTMITGVQPAEHGIYYNPMFEPNGSTGKIYWNDSSIKVNTLWDAAKDKNLKVAALFWPVSANAPVNFNIPDIGSLGEKVREQYSKPAGFVDDVRKNVFNGAEKIEYGKNTNIAQIAAYIIENNKPDLMAVHFFSVDHAEHVQGREGEMVKEAVADADSGVNIIISALKNAGIWDNTVLIVTGDHGFVNVKQTLSPNVWLKNAGFVNDREKGDWKAQFFTVGGSAFLYIKNNDVQTLQQVKSLLDKLPADKKKLFRIIDRNMLDKAGANPEVALALSGLNNTSFSNAFTGDDLKPAQGGTHGYFPDFKEIQTGFVAYGPTIKQGGVINEMNERDITSVVIKLLGLSLPSAKG